MRIWPLSQASLIILADRAINTQAFALSSKRETALTIASIVSLSE